MKREVVHSVVLGAGPAGLAAGYTLARAGWKPIVLEKAKTSGGLMRSIKRGEFIVDIGRKELYNRLARVDTFWSELLAGDYRSYPHRGGILYGGHIIEIAPTFRGFRRGMPWPLFVGCAWDLVAAQLTSNGQARNLEEYFYQKRGRRLTQVVSQGFQEKLTGTKWADIPLTAPVSSQAPDATFFDTLRGLATRTFSRHEVNTFENAWKHPAKGTGQICDALEAGIKANGGRMFMNADVIEVNSRDGFVNEVIAKTDGETVAYETQHLVSSIPAPFLLKLLLKDRYDTLPNELKAPPSSKKTIVLVYVSLDEPPHFPHAWLNVTCPQTRIGRITNYTGISGEMVPSGKTCLCCEYYCGPDDELLKLDDQGLLKLTLQELTRYRLADASKCIDSLIIRLPGADASQNRHNWMNNLRHGLLEQLRPFANVYYAARTDLDIATLAGIESAEAILTGDRSAFDRHLDPVNLEIRSVKKAFEFRNPTEQ